MKGESTCVIVFVYECVRATEKKKKKKVLVERN